MSSGPSAASSPTDGAPGRVEEDESQCDRGDAERERDVGRDDCRSAGARAQDGQPPPATRRGEAEREEAVSRRLGSAPVDDDAREQQEAAEHRQDRPRVEHTAEWDGRGDKGPGPIAPSWAALPAHSSPSGESPHGSVLRKS